MTYDERHAEMFPPGRKFNDDDKYDRYEQILRMQCFMAGDDMTDAQINDYMNAMKAQHRRDAENPDQAATYREK